MEIKKASTNKKGSSFLDVEADASEDDGNSGKEEDDEYEEDTDIRSISKVKVLISTYCVFSLNIDVQVRPKDSKEVVQAHIKKTIP